MSRRPEVDPERLRLADPQRTEGLPLFADERHAAIEAGLSALRDTAAKHEAEIGALVPLARELAGKAPRGITVSDLRLYAVQRGLLTGEERGRQLSYLGAVMRRAGLVPLAGYQRSSVVRSHGNLGRIWGLPGATDERGDAA